MLEETNRNQLPAERGVVASISEPFQIRIFFDPVTTIWTSVIHSVEDNQTMRLSHPNFGMLLKDVRSQLLKKEASLKVRNGHV